MPEGASQLRSLFLVTNRLPHYLSTTILAGNQQLIEPMQFFVIIEKERQRSAALSVLSQLYLDGERPTKLIF